MQLITYKTWAVHRLSKKEGRGKVPREDVSGGLGRKRKGVACFLKELLAIDRQLVVV